MGGTLALGPLPQGHCCASLFPDLSKVADGCKVTCIIQSAASGQRSSQSQYIYLSELAPGFITLDP